MNRGFYKLKNVTELIQMNRTRIMSEHQRLTLAAVLSSMSHGTVAGEGLPAHAAGAPVLTRVRLAEGVFGAAAWRQQEIDHI